MKKLLFVSVCVPVCLLFFCFFASASTSDSSHLLINQIQITGGSGKTTNDFIEIYNPTSQDIDLKGYRLVKRTETGVNDDLIKSWAESIIIPAGGYYLWANSSFIDIGITPDVTSTDTISNNNGIALRFGSDNTGEIIDSVGWGTASNSFVEGSVFATNPGANEVMVRTGVDTNNNSVDFVLSSNPMPRNSSAETESTETDTITDTDTNITPPQPPSPPSNPPAPGGGGSSAPTYSSAVKISEFMPNPEGTDSGNEWVELFSTAEVDLSNWILDDESSSGSVGSSAYKIPANIKILANGYLVIEIPAGSFALDNTGGDTLRLIWPNNQVLDSVLYTSSAPEGKTYARLSSGEFAWTATPTKNAANQFAAIIDTDDEEIDDEVERAGSIYENAIKINEIFPNPKGTDTGNEWVELVNTTEKMIDLKNWILDDGEIDAGIGTSSYKILESTLIAAKTMIQIKIPAGKFALNNTFDRFRLFDPDNVLIDTVAYEDAKEDQSFGKVGESWVWNTPSPSLPNPEPKIITYSDEIKINELFPYPVSGTDEFIELKNESDEEIDLTGWVIADKSTRFKLTDVKIPSSGFLVIHKSQSKIALNNFGTEIVRLENPLGEVVDQVEYEEPPKNESYSRMDDDFVWSTLATAGKLNVIKSAVVAKTAAEEILEILEEDLPINQPDIEEIGTVSGENLSPNSEIREDNAIIKPRSRSIEWFSGGFVIGSIICYSLIKLMARKENHE